MGFLMFVGTLAGLRPLLLRAQRDGPVVIRVRYGVKVTLQNIAPNPIDICL